MKATGVGRPTSGLAGSRLVTTDSDSLRVTGRENTAALTAITPGPMSESESSASVDTIAIGNERFASGNTTGIGTAITMIMTEIGTTTATNAH